MQLRSSSRNHTPLLHRLAALALCGLTLGACELYDGELPPADELVWPVSLALHPSGDYLYVLNSNFNATYRTDLGGTVTVVDTDTLQILPESTRCLPSYGGHLRFGTSTWGNGGDQPRMLVASTRGDNGLTAFRLSEDGSQLACLRRGEDIGTTCVDNITELPGVTRKRRVLPCSIPQIVRDPIALAAIAPRPGEDAEEQDAFVVSGLTGGVSRLVTYIDGEIRGHLPASGSEDPKRHLTERTFNLANGAVDYATHPLTGESYLAARYESRIRSFRWLREPLVGYDENPRAGFATGVAQTGFVQLPSFIGQQEVRGLVFSADGNRLYAIGSWPGVLNVIDTSLDEDGEPRNRPVARISIAGEPSRIALLPGEAGDRLYVSLADDRRLLVLDAESLARLAEIEVGARPYELLADPERQRIYIALFEDSAVAVLDANPASPTYNRLIGHIR